MDDTNNHIDNEHSYPTPELSQWLNSLITDADIDKLNSKIAVINEVYSIAKRSILINEFTMIDYDRAFDIDQATENVLNYFNISLNQKKEGLENIIVEFLVGLVRIRSLFKNIIFSYSVEISQDFFDTPTDELQEFIRKRFSQARAIDSVFFDTIRRSTEILIKAKPGFIRDDFIKRIIINYNMKQKRLIEINPSVKSIALYIHYLQYVKLIPVFVNHLHDKKPGIRAGINKYASYFGVNSQNLYEKYNEHIKPNKILDGNQFKTFQTNIDSINIAIALLKDCTPTRNASDATKVLTAIKQAEMDLYKVTVKSKEYINPNKN